MRRSLPAALAALILLALPAAASAATPGTYKGETDGGQVVNAKVSKPNKLARLSFAISTRCGSGPTARFSRDILFVENVRIKADGSSKKSSKGEQTDGLATFELKGKFKGSKLTGSVDDFFRNGCRAFELTFIAKRK